MNDPLIGNFTARQVRIQGGVLLVLGTALVLGVGTILARTAPGMLNPGVAIDGTTFTGTAFEGKVFIALLAWVVVLSAMFVAVGIQQLKTGTRMKALLYATFAVLGVGLLGIWYFRDYLMK